MHAMEAPARVGRYILAKRLGAGGMGVVHAPKHPNIDRRVAIKLLHDAAEHASRPRRPGAARVAHPNVVAVYDVGEHDGHVFIAMELVAGATLSVWLRAETRSWREIVGVFVQAGRGLSAVHKAGFIHRDFKPDNVLVGNDGRARITDFGLAQLGDDDELVAPPPRTKVTEITRTGAIAGTPAYMSPEQPDGGFPRRALGSVLVLRLAVRGALRHASVSGDTVVDLRKAIGAAAFREVGGRVPSQIFAALTRGLALEPSARYPSMDALLAVLDRPARGGALGVIASVAVVGLAAGVGWWTQPPAAADDDKPCTGAAGKLAGICNANRKAAIHAAFGSIARPFAEDAWRGVERLFDGYARDWVAMHEDTCLATAVRKAQPPEVLDLRMQCLPMRRAELETSVGFAPRGRCGARRARACERIVAVASCARRGAGRDAGLRIRGSALRSRRERRTRRDPRPRESHRLPTRGACSIAPSTARGRSPAPAEAETFVAGSVLRRDGDLEGASKQLQAAVLAAETGRADLLKALALVELVTVHETWSHNPDAHRFADQAAATIARIGGGGRAKARLERVLGDLLERELKPADAIPHYQAALDGYRREAGKQDDFEVATSLENLAAIELEVDRATDADAHYREAHDMMVRLVGGGHAHVATILAERAEALKALKKPDEAKRMLESGLEIAAAGTCVGAFGVSTRSGVRADGDHAADALAWLPRLTRSSPTEHEPKHTARRTVRLQGESMLELKRCKTTRLLRRGEAPDHREKRTPTTSVLFDEAIAVVYTKATTTRSLRSTRCRSVARRTTPSATSAASHVRCSRSGITRAAHAAEEPARPSSPRSSSRTSTTPRRG
jgi:tetratricopeptide (TPR) repeat protein